MNDEGSAFAAQVAALSLLAFGGVNSILPELHRFTVESRGWLDAQTFADLFALAQAAPGPNMMVVALIGWSLGGFAAALAATAAMVGPACLLTFAVAGVWDRFRDAPWRRTIQAALAPVTLGLVAAGALLLVQAADRSVVAALLTAATAAVALLTRLNPLWLLGLGAALGALGWV